MEFGSEGGDLTGHQALLFDLDGVLVNTAKYHFIAWKELAEELGIPFTAQDNERFKGVSRNRCMEILLELGGRTMTDTEKTACCDKKNQIYRNYIEKMGEEELLPGVKEFLLDVKAKGYRIALGSASKNSRLILDRLHLTGFFDAIIDGTKVSRAKPDPEVFLQGALALGVPPERCIVFEDAVAGVRAAHAGGMRAVGIGSRQDLPEADCNMPGFKDAVIEEIEARLAAAATAGP